MSLPEHIYALTNHCLDIVKQAPSSVHVHVIVVIVVVIIVVVIVVVCIDNVDHSLEGNQDERDKSEC